MDTENYIDDAGRKVIRTNVCRKAIFVKRIGGIAFSGDGERCSTEGGVSVKKNRGNEEKD